MSQPDYACNPYALYKDIKDNTEHETAWILKKQSRFITLRERGIKCALYNTIDGVALLKKADYVITNSYTFLELPKHDKQLFVNLWHGSGIKAHDFYDYNINPRHVKKLHNFFAKIDLMCVHSLDDRFRLSAQLNYDMRKVYVTGQPRLDCVRTSEGRGLLAKLLSDKILDYDNVIFFAPSFRANMSTHSGTFISDNIFRLNDYSDEVLKCFLENTNSALVYKLHPVEQTAFAGRCFSMNEHCYELTEDMLFDNDIRYTEILNAFNVMVSDYSSIAFDYLVLDRPIVYLIPDYEEYKNARGFVFHNVDLFMPGEKVYSFEGLLYALKMALKEPEQYKKERKYVIAQRFDFMDNEAAKRCYERMINYIPIDDSYHEYKSNPLTKMPSMSAHIKMFLPDNLCVVDATERFSESEYHEKTKVLYLTHEIPNEFRQLSGQSSAEIADIEQYKRICELPNFKIKHITGGVDYKKFFAASMVCEKKDTKRIGFAGTIDNRIYFAMVQSICESFPDYEVIFAGHIFGDYPIWMDGYDNLKYMEASYDDLPDIIATFDVAILPFFDRHKLSIPTELFQYLAVGKMVVTSDMPNLPKCDAIFTSKSITDAVNQIKVALEKRFDCDFKESAYRVAAEYDWSKIASKVLDDIV